MYTQIPSGVTPGIIILSNFMPSLHRVNKFGGGVGVERREGVVVYVRFSVSVYVVLNQ